MTTTFEKVMWRATRYGACPLCGKRVQRAKTFWHTVNPFNRNPDGTQKTYQEVLADVRADAEAWEPDFTHAKCAQLQDALESGAFL